MNVRNRSLLVIFAIGALLIWAYPETAFLSWNESAEKWDRFSSDSLATIAKKGVPPSGRSYWENAEVAFRLPYNSPMRRVPDHQRCVIETAILAIGIVGYGWVLAKQN